MKKFAKIDGNTQIRLVGEPLPFLPGGFAPTSGSVPCTGDDGCPWCKAFGKPTEKKVMATLTDMQDGTTKTMVVPEKRFNELTFKAVPKGRHLRFKVRGVEVIFWFMWWRLPLWERRRSVTTEFTSRMFGPWEIRRYG